MLTLTYHGTTNVPVEAEVINPSLLAARSSAEIARMPVQHGNVQVPLGEFFHVVGDGGDQHIVIEGDCSRVKWIGARMTSGKITVHGDAGMHLGAEMAGGDIIVHGRAGAWLGAELRAGRIHVHGDAGDLVGAAYRGSRTGMRGGVILIDGRAGDEVGATMRRGLIAVGAGLGDFAGVNMVAGSIFVFGPMGQRCGAGMKRGSLVCLGPPAELLPTFHFDCEYDPVFVRLYLKQLQAWNFGPATGSLACRFARFSGDVLALGKGEVLMARGGDPQ